VRHEAGLGAASCVADAASSGSRPAASARASRSCAWEHPPASARVHSASPDQRRIRSGAGSRKKSSVQVTRLGWPQRSESVEGCAHVAVMGHPSRGDRPNDLRAPAEGPSCLGASKITRCRRDRRFVVVERLRRPHRHDRLRYARPRCERPRRRARRTPARALLARVELRRLPSPRWLPLDRPWMWRSSPADWLLSDGRLPRRRRLRSRPSLRRLRSVRRDALLHVPDRTALALPTVTAEAPPARASFVQKRERLLARRLA